MFINVENLNASKQWSFEEKVIENDRKSFEVVQENVRAYLEPLNEHISILIKLLHQLMENT